jgi:hypothetical protein
MTTTHPPKPKRRSNRAMTDWACGHLGLFLQGGYRESCKRTQGNTTFLVVIEGRVQKCGIYLFDNLLLAVILDDWKPISVQVGLGSYWDGYGQPTATTAERLNGLLDCLGANGLIPSGVRVFRDKEAKMTYLGRGDDYVAVGKDYADLVYLKPNNQELEIVGSLIVHSCDDD